jgi:hypothetical protein
MANFEKYYSLLQSYQQLERKLTKGRIVLFERLLDAYLRQYKALYERNRTRAPNFNPFHILGLTTNELTHSDVLAWLFDPYGTHNQGDLFFKHFLKSFDFPINHDPWEYKVRREYVGIESIIDILVLGKDFIFYIENKTLSEESYDPRKREYQTEREHRDLMSLARTRRIHESNAFAIFLNPKGEPAQYKNWRPISYNQLAQALENTLSEIRSNYVKFFVQSWLSTLKIIGGEL